MAARLERTELLVGAWVLILGTFALADAWIDVLRGIAIEFVLALAGAALLLWVAVRVARRRSRRDLVALALLVAALSLWLSPVRFRTAVYFRAWVDSLRHAQDIADLEAGITARCVVEHRCFVEDPGPNAQVAFVWDGLAGHSFGVVYDERGSLRDLQASRFDFGGYVLSARHLWGPWYYCAFA